MKFLPKSIQRIAFLLLIFSAVELRGRAEEPSLVTSLGLTADRRMKMERTLEGIMLKFPKVVKLLEFYDEKRSLILLKLSDNSFGLLAEGSVDRAHGVANAENGAWIGTKELKPLTGDFKYEVFDPKFNQMVPTTYTWAIRERQFEAKPSRQLVFVNEFADCRVSISVDWEAGRVDAVKVLPLKKP